MGLLDSFRGAFGGSILGVDIGTTSIKAVEIARGNQLPRVVNYALMESSGHLIRANKVLQTSTMKIYEDAAADMLKELIARMKPGTRDAMASIPPFTAFMTTVDLPRMEEKDLAAAMQFQMKQYVPLPMNEVAIDWLRVSEYEDEKGYYHQQILLIVVPQEQIRRFQSLFKLAGLNLKALEVESFGLLRALIAGDTTPTMILDIGSRATSVTFCDQGQIRFVAQSDYAGSSLTQAISSSLNINPIRAEELKRQRGIVVSGPGMELSTVMLPLLDVILSEAKKAEYNYQAQFPNSRKAERVILSGGTANLLGVERYIEEQLQVPVVKAAPFLRFEHSTMIEPFLQELNPLLSVAMGVALREFP